MGCGTGGHAIPLTTRGYRVVGVDRSKEMVSRARAKAAHLAETRRPQFMVADIQTAALEGQFDAAICMFAVLGYQTTNQSVLATLRTARRHLKAGGVFVCDFWYGPAVLHQRPDDRVQEMRCGSGRIIRTARPKLDTEANTVAVGYHVLHLRGRSVVADIRETHTMRFFFKPEIEDFMAQSSLRLLEMRPFPNRDEPVSEKTWNVVASATAE
jgi:SAM-dependent methyltransferase